MDPNHGAYVALAIGLIVGVIASFRPVRRFVRRYRLRRELQSYGLGRKR